MSQVEALFGIDPETVDDIFEGFHDPSVRWNGWACPAFDRVQAGRVVAWINRNAERYGEDQYRARWDGDKVVVAMPDYQEDAEVYGPDADGRYAIGSWAWTWSEVDVPANIIGDPDGINAWLKRGREEARVYATVANAVNAVLAGQGLPFKVQTEATSAAGWAAVKLVRAALTPNGCADCGHTVDDHDGTGPCPLDDCQSFKDQEDV